MDNEEYYEKEELESGDNPNDAPHFEEEPESKAPKLEIELEEEEVHEPEEVEEEAQAPEEEAEEAPKRKNKIPAKTRINQIQREKYQALDEALRLRQENERLREMVDFSTQSAMHHYDTKVYHDIEKAKSLKAQAYEAGDVQAMTDADFALNKAITELNDIEKWKAQQALQNQYQGDVGSGQQQEPDYESIKNWATKHQRYLHPESEEYDGNLAASVQTYCDSLDANLWRNGRGDLILSDEYKQWVDRYIDEYNSRVSHGARMQPLNHNRGLNMKQSRGGVSPVRSGTKRIGPVSERSNVDLTKYQKWMAKQMKIPEDRFAQLKAQHMKDKPHRYI